MKVSSVAVPSSAAGVGSTLCSTWKAGPMTHHCGHAAGAETSAPVKPTRSRLATASVGEPNARRYSPASDDAWSCAALLIALRSGVREAMTKGPPSAPAARRGGGGR